MVEKNVLSETDEKHYQRALSLKRQGRELESLGAFLKVVEKREQAPQSHLEVGRLYLDLVQDPIMAIYHFRKFIEFRPDSNESPIVRQLIETAEKAFLKKLPGKPYESQIEKFDLEKKVETLKRKNEGLQYDLAEKIASFQKLKNKIGAYEASIAQSSQQPVVNQTYRGIEEETVTVSQWGSQEPVQQDSNGIPIFTSGEDESIRQRPQRMHTNPSVKKPAAVKSRKYVVVSGDSLYKISKKLYGTAKGWTSIYEANKQKMKSATDLKVGQELLIP